MSRSKSLEVEVTPDLLAALEFAFLQAREHLGARATHTLELQALHLSAMLIARRDAGAA